MNCNSSTFANGTTRVNDRAECHEPVTQDHGRSLLAVLGLLAGAVLVLRWVTA